MADNLNAVPFTSPHAASGTEGSKNDPYLTETRHGRLDNLPSDRLPREVSQDIFAKAQEQSILMSLGQQIPISINENVITRPDAWPEAGQVGGTTLESREGAEKPVSGYRFGDRTSFSPIKLAVIVTMSEEFARENVDQLYSDLAGKLSGAIARAADLAVFHGKNALTGGDLVGIEQNGFINETANRVALNYAPGAGEPDLVSQLMEGYNLVVDDDEKNYDFTGFAAHPTLRSRLVQARDLQGNPIFQGGFPGSGAQISLNNSPAALFGIPVNWGRIVGGKVGKAPATNVKMFGGDWSQLAYGYADSIRIKVSDSATLRGANGEFVSLWQTNQLAVLAEATFGWYVADPDAFAAYTEGEVASV